MLVPVKLRYDGKYEFVKGIDPRQWTVVSHFIDRDGADRYRSSFMLEGLREAGILQ